MRRLTAYRDHSHHFYFTNPGWYDGRRRLLMSSDREDRNVNLATGLVMNDPAASSGVSGFSRNLSAASGGEWTRRSFKMTGCYDHFGVSRLYTLFIKDKQAIRHSVNKVLSSASTALCSGTANSSQPTAE